MTESDALEALMPLSRTERWALPLRKPYVSECVIAAAIIGSVAILASAATWVRSKPVSSFARHYAFTVESGRWVLRAAAPDRENLRRHLADTTDASVQEITIRGSSYWRCAPVPYRNEYRIQVKKSQWNEGRSIFGGFDPPTELILTDEKMTQIVSELQQQSDFRVAQAGRLLDFREYQRALDERSQANEMRILADRLPLVDQYGRTSQSYALGYVANGLFAVVYFMALLAVALLLASTPSTLHRRRMLRQLRSGCCPTCRYTLDALIPTESQHGVQTVRCPECGSLWPAPPNLQPPAALIQETNL